MFVTVRFHLGLLGSPGKLVEHSWSTARVSTVEMEWLVSEISRRPMSLYLIVQVKGVRCKNTGKVGAGTKLWRILDAEPSILYSPGGNMELIEEGEWHDCASALGKSFWWLSGGYTGMGRNPPASCFNSPSKKCFAVVACKKKVSLEKLCEGEWYLNNHWHWKVE